MSLYMNEKEKTIYKNQCVTAPNQAYYQSDQRAEQLQEQREQMNTVLRTLTDLKMVQTQAEKGRQEMLALLQQFRQHSHKQQTVGEGIVKAMQENKNLLQSVMSAGQETKQALLHELTQMNSRMAYERQQQKEDAAALDVKMAAANNKIDATQIMQEQTLAELAVQYDQTEKLQESLQSQKDLLQAHVQLQESAMEKHKQTVNSDMETRQAQMSKRMENQEAAMEKMMRQVNGLRSIIYERTSHLADKMEEGFRLSSAFAYHLLTRKDQPITMLYKNEKRQ